MNNIIADFIYYYIPPFCAGLGLSITNVVVGLALVVLYDCKVPFSNSHLETGKSKGLLLIRPRNYTAHVGPHSNTEGRV